MKKILITICCLIMLCGCGNKAEKETGSYTCSYGKEGDEFYVNIIVNYDNDVVKKFTFNQYTLLALVDISSGGYDTVIDEYVSSMQQIAGIFANASKDGDYMHYNYTVDLKNYNSASDPLGVIIKEALDDNGNTDQKKLRKYLESKEMGYACE